MKNSTFSDKFEKVAAGRFYENFIAEQVMVGAAMGLAARGAIPFPSTFACFLTRASDFIRMGAISFANVKFTGSHAGVSIGEDGPSQMALEDLSMMRSVHGCAVLYPCDAVSTRAARRRDGEAPGHGLHAHVAAEDAGHLRPGRDDFRSADRRCVRQSANDTAAVIGAGVTLFEALKAYDQLKAQGIEIRVIDAYSLQPVDAKTMTEAGRATGGVIITVEDHYAAGGLGDAVERGGGTGRLHRAATCGRARFRAAASRTNCSIATASPRATSSRRSSRHRSRSARKRGTIALWTRSRRRRRALPPRRRS